MVPDAAATGHHPLVGPVPMASAHAPDRAFEVFVKRTITTIQKEAWGRNREARELRDACQNVLNLLAEHEQGLGHYGGSLAVAVLEPLYLACASNNPKVVEAALGCLHKLVAHAWLQGESSSGGQADRADVVSTVIRTVIHCGEAGDTSEAQQLAVVRALLTFTTSEHFVAHGDCLLAAVRMVFNLALGAGEEVIKRTASNALLQMLNTIAKRVTSYPLFASSSAGSSRTQSVDGSGLGLGAQHHHHAYEHGAFDHAPDDLHRAADRAARERHKRTSSASGQHQQGGHAHEPGDGLPASSSWSSRLAAAGAQGQGGSTTHGDERDGGQQLLRRQHADDEDGGGRAGGHDGDSGGGAADGRAEHFASLAEQRDLRGLEAAIGSTATLEAYDVEVEDAVSPAAAVMPPQTAPAAERKPSISLRTSTTSFSAGGGAPTPHGHGRGARRTHSKQELVEDEVDEEEEGADGEAGGEGAAAAASAAASALEGASSGSDLPSLMLPRGGGSSGGLHHHQHGAPEAPVTPSHGAVTAGHGHHHRGHGQDQAGRAVLRTCERDVLLVLSAFSKLASREAGVTDIDSYLQQGKLLALELVVKVLQNPQHSWENVRDEFVSHLHQPFSMALLRNCSPTDLPSFGLALKLLTALVLQPKLRRGLKAEMGAFYPLLLLRPLEAGSLGAGDLAAVAAVLPCLRQLCAEPQLLVDVFVNYDCEMRAPNLYERTVQALSKLAQRLALDGAASQPATKQQAADAARQLVAVREAAVSCLLSVISSLDAWASPLKEAIQQRGNGAPESAGAVSIGSTPPPRPTPPASSGYGSGRVSGGGGSASTVPSSTSASSSFSVAAAAAAKEAGRVEAAKVTKSSLEAGLALFNGGRPVKAMRSLISSGLVESSPIGAATFLRAHVAELDLSAVGEYFGHHEDFEVAAMHAFIDMERYSGLAIDVALRRLLAQFRLPGEAQKIDRIMEKFAERFCRDNPGAFRNADAAYVLSFAIIMLNTDAHNPLAERRLTKADFIAMNSQPATAPAAADGPAAEVTGALGELEGEEDDGEEGTATHGRPQQQQPVLAPGGVHVMEPVLPAEELGGIYDRIVMQEIVVREGLGDGRGRGAGSAPAGRANKLAAALGLRALAAPLRSTLGGWDKRKVGAAERRRHHQQALLETAQRTVAAQGVSGRIWTTSAHAEHARPMLSVSGAALLAALSLTFEGLAAHAGPDGLPAAQHEAAVAAGLGQVEALLAGAVTLAELAGLLGLEELCEQAIGAFARHAGVSRPAPYGGLEAQKQLAALRALLGAAVGPEAGQLGSAWAVILRATSEVEALVRALSRPLQPGEQPVALMPPPAGWGPAHSQQQQQHYATAANGSNGAAGSGYSSIGRMFQALGLIGGAPGGGGGGNGGGATASSAANNGGAAPGQPPRGLPPRSGSKDAPPASGSQQLPPPPVRGLPGAALAMWALTDGRATIEQVYQRSTSLDGEAVVVFFRALCAVSREELDGPEPRCYSLQRLAEVAAINMACRIRLIASKVWAVTSAHLVMTACHPTQAVATQAVEAMRGLAVKLLGRPELAHYTAQEQALRPFSAVMRQADDPGVRQLAVQSVVQAMNTYSRSLGSGWRMVVEVMRRAAADPSDQVLAHALVGLRSVVAALYAVPPASAAGVGGAGSVGAPAAALSPAGGHECYHDTLRAVLAALRNANHPDDAQAAAAVQLLVGLGERLALRQGVGPQADWADDDGDASSASWEALAAAPSAGGGGGGALNPTSGSGAAAFASAGSGLVPRGSLWADLGPLSERAAAAAAAGDDWALLMEVVADSAAAGDRPRLANASLEAAFDVMRCHGRLWSRRAWRVMLGGVLQRVAFRVPPALDPQAHPEAAAEALASGLPLESIASGFVARVERWFPLLSAQLATAREVQGPGLHAELLQLLAATSLAWFRHCVEAVSRAGLAAISRLLAGLAAAGSSAAAAGMAHQTPSSSSPASEAFGAGGWDILLPLLEAMLAQELQLVMAFTSKLAAMPRPPPGPLGSGALAHWRGHRISSTSAAGSPPPAGDAAAAATAVAAAQLADESKRLHCRCRMLVLLQRTLGAALLRDAGRLPWPVARRMLEQLMIGTGQKVMRFNMREELRLPDEVEAAAAGSSPDAGGAALLVPEGSGADTGKPQAWTAGNGDNGWGEGWSDNDDDDASAAAAEGDDGARAAASSPGAGAGADGAAEEATTPLANGPAPGFSQDPPSAVKTEASAASIGGGAAAPSWLLANVRLQLPAGQLELSSATSHDSSRPALTRLEVEPLDTSLDVLLACSRLPQPDAAAEAEQLLLQTCSFVLACHADAQPAAAPAHHASALIPGDPAALDPSLPGSSWDHAVRAPVLARCVRLLLVRLPGEAERLALLPQLLVLMTSHQAVVRYAVADYLEALAAPHILQLAEAAEAAAAAAAADKQQQAGGGAKRAL